MKIEGKEYLTIWFDEQNQVVKIIDQTKLPHQFIITDLKTVKDSIKAIKTMEVRGAPLIGATAAYGLVLSIIENFEKHIDPKDPTNNCLDVAIITAPGKRTQKTKDKLNTVAGRVLKK